MSSATPTSGHNAKCVWTRASLLLECVTSPLGPGDRDSHCPSRQEREDGGSLATSPDVALHLSPLVAPLPLPGPAGRSASSAALPGSPDTMERLLLKVRLLLMGATALPAASSQALFAADATRTAFLSQLNSTGATALAIAAT